MSGTLVWQPHKKDEYKSLPLQLRIILESKWSFPVVFGYAQLDYLSGLNDAGVDGAQELMELIHQFEEIELNIEY